MLNRPLKEFIVSSIIIIISIYGFTDLFTEIFTRIFPFGIIFTILVIILGVLSRVPAPGSDLVEAIMGKDLNEATENDLVIRTIAHRGAGLDAPENTLAAFQMCKEKGCDVIEFDVTLTQDDVPVVFHDDTLERMTDLNLKISEQKWENLANIDLSVKHPLRDRFPKTNIPTLEQTVNQLLSSGQRMIIDIKDNNIKFVKIIHDLFKNHPELYSRAVVSTFFPKLIYFIRKGDPKIVCSMAWRPHFFAYTSYKYPLGKGERRAKNWYTHYGLVLLDLLHEWALPRITYYILGLSIILLHKDTITAKTVLDWKKKGVRVMPWTVNLPSEKQYFARALKITYLTDTFTGEATTHSTTN